MTDPIPVVPRRPGRRAGRDKTPVLEAACRVVAERGAAATRFRDVSEASGVPVSTLQYYFGSLEDLIIAVFRYNNEYDLRRLRAGVAKHQDPWEQLMHLVELSFEGDDETYEQSVVLWMEFWRAAVDDQELAEEYRRAETMWKHLFERAIRRGVETELFHLTTDIETAVTTASALIDGMGVRARLGGLGIDREAGKRLIVDVLVALLRPDELAKRGSKERAPGSQPERGGATDSSDST